MKVRMKTLMSGPDGTFQPNEVANFPESQAKELIASGYAVAEKATLPVVENASNHPAFKGAAAQKLFVLAEKAQGEAEKAVFEVETAEKERAEKRGLRDLALKEAADAREKLAAGGNFGDKKSLEKSVKVAEEAVEDAEKALEKAEKLAEKLSEAAKKAVDKAEKLSLDAEKTA